MVKTKQVGKGLMRLLGYTRRSTVWCHDRQLNLEKALRSHIQTLFESNNVYVLSIKRLQFYRGSMDIINEQINAIVQQIRNDFRFRGSFWRCMGKKIAASTVETNGIDEKIKGYIKDYLLFNPFRPLMIPLSNVARMLLLTKGDQKLFLIGEFHGDKFCRDKGYTPLAQIIEEYLQSRSYEEPVDFMLEMTNYKHENTPEHLENTRTFVKGRTGIPNSANIEFTRELATHYLHLKNTNSRVHWLDIEYPFKKNKTDKLLLFFYEFVINATPDYLHSRWQIDKYLIDDLKFTPKWSIRHGYDGGTYETNNLEKAAFLRATDEDKINFLKTCYDALRGSIFFSKCYGVQVPSWEIYRDVFIESLKKHTNSIDEFYFNVQRFFMDMYTCCRIMKTDAGWYKNIVIYAGDNHVQNYIDILTRLGFESHELPEPIEFNPYCE